MIAPTASGGEWEAGSSQCATGKKSDIPEEIGWKEANYKSIRIPAGFRVNTERQTEYCAGVWCGTAVLALYTPSLLFPMQTSGQRGGGPLQH